jgi:hypothetical protein
MKNELRAAGAYQNHSAMANAERPLVSFLVSGSNQSREDL